MTTLPQGLEDVAQDLKVLVELSQRLPAMRFDDRESCENFDRQASYVFDRLEQHVDELHRVVYGHGIGYRPLALRAADADIEAAS